MSQKTSKITGFQIGAIVILIIFIPLAFFLIPAIERMKVRQTNRDLKEIARALEELFIDNSTYPYTDAYYKTGEKFLHGFSHGHTSNDYEEIAKEVYMLPPMSVTKPWPNYYPYNRFHLRDYKVLTSPIAYISEIPKDPFNREGNRHYRYGISHHDSYWILAGNGPDGDEDLDVDRFCLESGLLIAHNSSDTIYYGYDKPLTEYMYDPTNGTKSNGDIIRIRQ